MSQLREGYLTKAGKPMDVDRPFYDRLAQNVAYRSLLDEFIVPIRSGRAWPMRAGQICRIVVIEGPQVADFNAWNLYNPREHFWASRTKQLQKAHVTTYDRLWSCLPYLRPMLTITNDTVRYSRDGDGAGCHDLLGSRCDPYVRQLLTGEQYDYHCHSNLVRAIAPYNLAESDIHDVLNIFQITGLTDQGRYATKPSTAKKGDFFEFFAEIDLLCAFSTCPSGDLYLYNQSPNDTDIDPTLAHCHPLRVEVYEPHPGLLDGWNSPRQNTYQGTHGIRLS